MIKKEIRKVSIIKRILKKLHLKTYKMTCYVLLTALKLTPKSKWDEATDNWFKCSEVIKYANNYYHENYKDSSKETARKIISNLVSIGVLERNTTITNSPEHAYKVTNDFYQIIMHYKKRGYVKEINKFIKKHNIDTNTYSNYKTKLNKSNKKFKVTVGKGRRKKDVLLTSNKHNQLLKETFEFYIPKHIGKCECLHIDGTGQEEKESDTIQLEKLNLNIPEHGKKPDLIVYSKEKNTAYFIEAVTSSGVITNERLKELKSMTKYSLCKIEYITIFSNNKIFSEQIEKVANKTTIWFKGEKYNKR